MVLFHACVVASTVVIARVAAVPLRLSREALTGFMLVVVCSNSGNYGLPGGAAGLRPGGTGLRERTSSRARSSPIARAAFCWQRADAEPWCRHWPVC